MERIKRNLRKLNFEKVAFDLDNAEVYYKSIKGVCYAMNFVDYHDTNSIDEYTLYNMNRSVETMLHSRGFASVKLLVVISTYSPQIAATLVNNTYPFWVIDTYHQQLVIPQNQAEDFCGMRSVFINSLNNMEVSERPPMKVFTMNNLMVLINVLVFIWLEINGSTQDLYYMIRKGAMYQPMIQAYGEYYRFFTCMFMHFGISHIFNNMVVLAFIGDNLERAVGKWKYLSIYLGSGLIASVTSYLYYIMIDEAVVSAGASGAVFGVIGALIYIVAVNKGKLEDLTSRRLGIFVAMSLYMGFTSVGVDNAAHVGGLIAGFAMAKVLYKKKTMEKRYEG